MNYLVDCLSRDVFTHLIQYSKLFEDYDIYCLARTSRTILELVGPKYELTNHYEWCFYRWVDIEAVGLKLPWTNPEEKSRYIINDRPIVTSIFAPSPPSPHDPSILVNEWVILRHRVERLTGLGYSSLPLESLQPIESEHTSRSRRTIGRVTKVMMWAPPPPHRPMLPFSEASDLEKFTPEWSIDLLQLPHLRFIPTTVTDLWMDDLCTNEMEIIQTYVWPPKLHSLRLNGFNPYLCNESMVSHWPVTLEQLTLHGSPRAEEGGMYLKLTNGRIYFPSTLNSLELAYTHVYFSNTILSESFTKSLTYLKCSPLPRLHQLQLHETSIQRLELSDGFNSSVDGWVLPPSLLDLKFGSSFNQPLNGLIFNTSLTRLSLIGFHRSLRGVVLPESLVSLELGPNFGSGRDETLVDIKLPVGLQTLRYDTYIDVGVYQPNGFNYPASLTHLEVGYELPWNVPPWKGRNSHPLQFVLPVNLIQLDLPLHLLVAGEPQLTKLEHLIITTSSLERNLVTPEVMNRLNKILASMNQLHHLGIEFNHIATDCDRLVLPDTVNTLIIGGKFVGVSKVFHPVKSYSFLQRGGIRFGTKLKQLHFKGEFNQSLNGVIFPESLKEIEFLTDIFNRPLDEVSFPSQLEKLTFSPTSKFNRPIHRIKFPSSLTILQLPPGYNQPLTGLVIPPQLRVFDLGDLVDTSRFTHIDSLLQLNFPSTIRWIILPHPSTTHLATHPQLSDYQAWVRRLRHLHLEAYIQFTLVEPPLANDSEDDEMDDDEEEEEEDDHDDTDIREEDDADEAMD